MSYFLYLCVTAVVTVHDLLLLVYMCEMSQLVLGGMAKGHELLQQLLHRGIGSRTLSLSLYYILLMIITILHTLYSHGMNLVPKYTH